MSLATSFGNPKSIDNEAELHAMLHNDDLVGWQRRNVRESAPLDAWLRDNVVHAMQSCPRVLAHWQKTYNSSPVAESILYRYVGAALESLDDNAKAGILSGYFEGEAQAGLFSHITKRTPNWSSLSPAWIGPPGSDLRDAALARGWSDIRLLSQVAHAIGRPEAQRWQAWVPYAHSIAVFNRAGKVMWEKKNPSPNGLQPVKKVGQAWARPEDMALAMALAKHMPSYLYTIESHPDAAPIPTELQERMDALVAVHAGLGMMFTLQKGVVAGTLPSMEPQEPIELPELGMQ